MSPKKNDPIQEVEVQTTSPPTTKSEQKPSYYSRQNEDLLTINDQERGVAPEDSDDVKWNYIAGAYARRLVLTGVVSGLESLDSDNPICVVDYEGIRVLIPGRQMFMDEWPEGERIPQSFRIRLGRILGATVDFILVGVDVRNRAAVASRRAAMLQRQAKYYATGRIKPGIRVACRVIAVGGNRVTLEAVGVDCEVNANALSWEWFPDVTDLFSTEDLVVAKVMDVTKDENTGHYSVKLSVKAATENPDLPSLRKLVPGSNFYGVVPCVHDKLIFVRLQAGANAKTKLFRTREIPSKLDTVSFQVRGIDEDTGVALGLITRIIRRHSKLR